MFIVRRMRKQFFEKKCSKWDSNSCPAVDADCKAFVRWATGKRLTNRLPKLSLITLFEQRGESVIRLSLGRRLVNLLPVAQRTNALQLASTAGHEFESHFEHFFYILWGPRESDSSDS